MPVPKASVHKYDGFVFRQYDVGCAGQLFAMEAEAVAVAVEHRSNHQLGFSVLSLDRGHIPRAFFWSERIHSEGMAFVVLGFKFYVLGNRDLFFMLFDPSWLTMSV